MNLRIFDDSADVMRAAARTIVQRAERQERSAIAISGGSTPRPLLELLGSSPHRDVLAKRSIVWVLVDERYVPADDSQSNSRMIRSTLFREGIPPAHRFLDFDTSFDDPAQSAIRFEQEWHALGLQILDVAVLGVGEDGHTASLFPATPVLDVVDGIAAAVFVPRLEQWRVTLTLPVIRAASVQIVLAVGEAKAAVVRDVRAGVDHPVTRATGGDVESWWFVDRPAAAALGT